MIHNQPKVDLGFWPTPLHHLKNLSEKLGGPQIYIKRDDQTGLATGGNKTRKLEYLLGDALARNCDTVITGGASQSNHCRQTAAAAAMNGLKCHLALAGTPPLLPDGNLMLDYLFNAKIHWTKDHRRGEDISVIADEMMRAGHKLYIIPYGGSNPVGALGFVKAIQELKDQMEAIDTSFTHIVFASSSGGSHAGLEYGARMLGLPTKIYGIAVEKQASQDRSLREKIADLCNGVSALLGNKRDTQPGDLILDDRFIGKGYGIVGDLERKAIGLLARTEGILLDPVYTGRAFGAMLNLISDGSFSKNDKLLFWHTGGTPALFPYASTLFKQNL
jgi:D-cysteine desulfhydrase